MVRDVPCCPTAQTNRGSFRRMAKPILGYSPL